MKQRIFNLIILDESGSMSSIERQAVEGINETIHTIRGAQEKHDNQEHFLTLVSFNSNEVKIIYNNVAINLVEEFLPEQYRPSCSTPLYDAMGNALTKLRNEVEENDAVLVTVITDGYENASNEYDGRAIKSLVKSLKNNGWLFTYIGANQDVDKAAATIAITNTLSFTANSIGTKEMFERDTKAKTRWFNRLGNGISKMFMTDDYYDED